MADSVEADLEAPEALSIAREDVLLRKMEEERERYMNSAIYVNTQHYSSTVLIALSTSEARIEGEARKMYQV